MKYFRYERDLVDVVLNDLNWVQQLGYKQEPFFKATEFEGFFGVPDIMLSYSLSVPRCGTSLVSIAVEAKLSAWRPALIQAYRYKAFAHFSFVAIDEARSAPAMKNLDFFKRSQIGLIVVSLQGNIDLAYRPNFATPYCSGLANKLRTRLLPSLD